MSEWGQALTLTQNMDWGFLLGTTLPISGIATQPHNWRHCGIINFLRKSSLRQKCKFRNSSGTQNQYMKESHSLGCVDLNRRHWNNRVNTLTVEKGWTASKQERVYKELHIPRDLLSEVRFVKAVTFGHTHTHGSLLCRTLMGTTVSAPIGCTIRYWRKNVAFMKVRCLCRWVWYDIFVNCSWVVTRWQKYSTHLHTNNT